MVPIVHIPRKRQALILKRNQEQAQSGRSQSPSRFTVRRYRRAGKSRSCWRNGGSFPESRAVARTRAGHASSIRIWITRSTAGRQRSTCSRTHAGPMVRKILFRQRSPTPSGGQVAVTGGASPCRPESISDQGLTFCAIMVFSTRQFPLLRSCFR